MKICVLLFLFLFFAATCVLGDPPLFPIKTEDLQSIVDSVKKDVDTHLKVAYASRQSLLDSPKLSPVFEEADDGKEYRNFMKMIHNSMHHHLVRNLGQPSDMINEGLTYSKSTQEDVDELSTKSVSQQVSETTTIDHSESPEASEIRIGSVKGMAGINFPDYTDIPITSFSCSQKPHLPGFYADLDTGCQVFHFCWPDRRESFLCPLGTTFNQALGVCDYWYNSNCSLAPYYYTINAEVKPDLSEPENESTTMVDTLLEESVSGTTREPVSTDVYSTSNPTVFTSRFMPVKAKIVVYPKTATKRLKIVATASVGEDKANIKLKRQQKTSNTSKHTRLPRSVEYAKSSKDADIKDQEYEIIRFRLFEALKRAVMDIENDESVSALSGYARTGLKVVKSALSFLFMDEPLEHISPEPGSELYEYDMQAVKSHENLREVWKKFLLFVATFMDEETEKEVVAETSNDVNEREVTDSEPLTNLNPKFIVKAASEQTSKLEDQMLPPIREKRSLTILHPFKLKHKDRLTIHPTTKKVLLKNYMKLFKAKYKH